jgi:hypothetical protein
MRTHSAAGKARKRPAGFQWPVSRLFWGTIAGMALAAIGLFTAALLLGPIHVQGRLASVPSTLGEAPAVPGPAPLPASSPADPATDPASSEAPQLLTVPRTQATTARPAESPGTTRAEPSAVPVATTARPTRRIRFSPAASSPAPAHSHRPSPAPSPPASPTPDPVISPGPGPTQGDSEPPMGSWPSDYEAP